MKTYWDYSEQERAELTSGDVEELEGKQGYKWYLWVFRSQSTVVYVLDPSRAAEVDASGELTDEQDVDPVDDLALQRRGVHQRRVGRDGPVGRCAGTRRTGPGA